MVSLGERLEASELSWVDHPNLILSDGSKFSPRVATLEAGKPKIVICTFPNHEMEKGLTTDIKAARSIKTADLLIHLRSHAESSFIGLRDGNQFRYEFAPENIDLGPVSVLVADLCRMLPTEQRSGWNDNPLSGRDLPSFDDMESFLNWWDFHPGKQSFEIIEGQVVLTKGFTKDSFGPAALRGMFGVAAREVVQKPYHAFKGLLVRLNETTALCPDLVICKWDGSDNPFVDAKAAVIFQRPNLTTKELEKRVEWLKNVGVDVAILDPQSREYTGEFGTKTTHLSYGDYQLPLQDILTETLDSIGFGRQLDR